MSDVPPVRPPAVCNPCTCPHCLGRVRDNATHARILAILLRRLPGAETVISLREVLALPPFERLAFTTCRADEQSVAPFTLRLVDRRAFVNSDEAEGG